MKRIYFVSSFLILLATLFNQDALCATDRPNVILLMIDGVRQQELFHGSDPQIDADVNETQIFKDLLNPPNKNIFIIGDKDSGRIATVANPTNLSLPGYQSIMAGVTTPCRSNSCGRTRFETMQERILRELKLKKTDVATIASWPEMALAVESKKNTTFVNAGVEPLEEGITDATTTELNKKQSEDTPSWDGRKDIYTWNQAINYLKNNLPRFLYISLDDADELAHKGKYSKHIETLKWYNEKIKELFEVLDSLGEYGKSTTVIITTDHGRGSGRNWTSHGPDYADAKYIWLFGTNPMIPKGRQRPASTNFLTHLDIRPTIEKIMGLAPLECLKCGKPIPELLLPEAYIYPQPLSSHP